MSPNNGGLAEDLPNQPVPASAAAIRVALVGAEHTGRRELHRALLDALPASASAATLNLTVVHMAEWETRCCGQPFDAVLLMGLDLPSARHGAWQDQAWRARLQQARVAFQVIYGVGPARLQSALAALAPLASLQPDLRGPWHAQGLEAANTAQNQPNPARWQGWCEKCSDADGEHRLFAALKSEKAGKPTRQLM